jgi:phosphatidylserine/phosphatidylglycerophosphate/cardiolipin synthase-like enzyme
MPFPRIQKNLFSLVLWTLIALSSILFGKTIYTDTFVLESTRSTLPSISLPPNTLTLFSEPESGVIPVLKTIESAQKSIDLVMYDFKDMSVAKALIAKHADGVAVRVLLDHGYYGKPDKKNDDMFAYFQKNNVPVQWTPATFALTHQKTIVVDNTKALIMTFNLTPQYYATGRDFGIFDTDAKDVEAIENTFSADWNKEQIGSQYGEDLVWSPNAENDLITLIESAKSNLIVYNEEMADEKIIGALEDAAARGVSVQIVMTNAGNWRTAFVALRNAGVSIHTFSGSKSLYIHAKMILADESYGFVGSQNFSANSLLKNRELGLFITDPTILSSLGKTFAQDYANGKVF